MLRPKTPLFSFITRGSSTTASSPAASCARLFSVAGDAALAVRCEFSERPNMTSRRRGAAAGSPCGRRSGPSASMIRSTPSPSVIRITSASKSLAAVVDRVVDALGPDRLVLGGRGGAEDLGADVAGELGRRGRPHARYGVPAGDSKDPPVRSREASDIVLQRDDAAAYRGTDRRDASQSGHDPTRAADRPRLRHHPGALPSCPSAQGRAARSSPASW